MKIIYKIILFLIVFTFLIVSGCAGPPRELEMGQIRAIRKLAIVTSMKSDEPQILYRPEDYKPSLTGTVIGAQAGATGGALGSLIGGLANTAAYRAKIRASMGGNPDLLWEKLGTLPVKEVFDKKIVEHLPKRFEVVGPEYFNSQEQRGLYSKVFDEKNISEYLAMCKQIGADTILSIRFEYGVTAYPKAKPTVAVDADIEVVDVKTEKLLMQKKAPSDLAFHQGHTVDELSANDAKLFREGLPQAIDGVCRVISMDLDITMQQGM